MSAARSNADDAAGTPAQPLVRTATNRLPGDDGRLWGVMALATTLCVLVNNLCWTYSSEIDCRFDFPLHAMAAALQYDNLRLGRLADFFILPQVNHGPGVYQPAALYMSVFGLAPENLLSSSCLWIPIYGLAVYGIGRTLYDERTGFWSIVFFFSIPGFVDFGKQYPGEVVSHATVLLALLALFRSGMLRRRVPSALFGLAVGAGLLTKSEIAAVWAGPLGFLLLRTSWEHFRTRGGRWLFFTAFSLVVSFALHTYVAYGDDVRHWILQEDNFRRFAAMDIIAVAAIVAALWRKPSEPFWNGAIAAAILLGLVAPLVLGKSLAGIASERMAVAGEGFYHGGRWIDPLYYLWAIAGHLFGGVYAALFLGGCVAFVVRGDHRDERRGFFFWMLVYLCLLINIVAGKFEIYLFNIFGFSAVIATAWIARGRLWVMALVGVYAWAQLFGWLLLPFDRATASPLASTTFDRIVLPPQRVPLLPILSTPPRHTRLAAAEIATRMYDTVKRPFVFVVGSTPYTCQPWHADLFHMIATYRRLPMKTAGADDPEIGATPGLATDTLPLFLALEGDYTVRTGEGVVRFYATRLLKSRRSLTADGLTVQLFAAFRLEYGWNMLIYRIRRGA